MGGIVSWWDGVELWLTGRGFLLQVVVVMPVVLALAYGLAVLADVALGNGIRFLHSIRSTEGDAVVNGMPRSRVTLALIALLLLVVVAWLISC